MGNRASNLSEMLLILKNKQPEKKIVMHQSSGESLSALLNRQLDLWSSGGGVEHVVNNFARTQRGALDLFTKYWFEIVCFDNQP